MWCFKFVSYYSNIMNSLQIFKLSEFSKGEIGLYQFGEERVRLPFGVLPDTMNLYNGNVSLELKDIGNLVKA